MLFLSEPTDAIQVRRTRELLGPSSRSTTGRPACMQRPKEVFRASIELVTKVDCTVRGTIFIVKKGYYKAEGSESELGEVSECVVVRSGHGGTRRE